MKDDSEIIKEVLNGNTKNFNSLVIKYESMIQKYIYCSVRNKELTSDLTQEVFISVYEKLYTYNTGLKFSNWILKIAKNKCIDYIRKSKKLQEINIDDIPCIASDYNIPECTAELHELRDNIKNFINSLEKNDRDILILKCLNDNMRFIDVAQILDISESRVKRRFYKIKDCFIKQYIR